MCLDEAAERAAPVEAQLAFLRDILGNVQVPVAMQDCDMSGNTVVIPAEKLISALRPFLSRVIDAQQEGLTFDEEPGDYDDEGSAPIP